MNFIIGLNQIHSLYDISVEVYLHQIKNSWTDGREKNDRERLLVPTMHGNVGMEKNQWKVAEDDTVIVDPSDKEQVI